jgi:molybdenum cofactor cytidylyltransferase
VKFGSFKASEAEGATLAHAVRVEVGVLKKGRVLSAIDVTQLLKAGITEVVAAKLDGDDIPEDSAAHEIAVAACGIHAVSQPAFTGRANLYSDVAGLLVIDEVRVRAINHLHESLTVATLPNFARVETQNMLATIKIIPFAVPRHVRDAALEIIADGPLVKVAPFKALRVGLVITKLPQTKETLIAKSESAIRDRVVALGGVLSTVVVCDHTQNAVRHAIEKLSADIILVFGASAIVDRADVIPAALVDAGGEVLHVGMPVDPGNLLMLGSLKAIPVVGVPSCARSPKTNGFDWVLARLMAGLDVTPHDIMDMGVGGLLAEIPSRPSPRDPQPSLNTAPRVAALVLAAGSSTRMGSNKLLADIQGQPMIARTVQRIAQSSVEKIMVVTGHQSEVVGSALQGQGVELVHNANFALGLSTSLRLGVSKLQNSCDAILVCLGDMPLIDARDINRMIAAFNPTENRSIVVPVHGSKFGNPVLWGASHFASLMVCEGDRGARGLLETLREEAVEIPIAHEGVVLDADTPEALALIRSIASTEN